MPLSEQELIQTFFAKPPKRKDVVLGVGDDCAVLSPPENLDLAVTTDTLVEGVHFLPDTPPQDIGYKAVAVNLSDLAAMGAQPSWLSLSLAMPISDAPWLKSLCRGINDCTQHFDAEIIGGDTVHSQTLTLTITAQGFIPKTQAITRTGANIGDLIYVTGTLGDAGAGLLLAQGKLATNNPQHYDFLVERLHRPTPRIAAGMALRPYATSMCDISDGLLIDLKRLLTGSDVGAIVNVEQVPLSIALKSVFDSDLMQHEVAMTGGDDYELCFTVPEDKQQPVEAALESVGCSVTCIGRIVNKPHCKLLRNNELWTPRTLGYDHFAEPS
ncbi:MAG: thiamine-phosphate kinase [Pseudomonadota bacterium]